MVVARVIATVIQVQLLIAAVILVAEVVTPTNAAEGTQDTAAIVAVAIVEAEAEGAVAIV